MRKLFAMLTVLALLLPVLAGCRSTPPVTDPGNPQTTQTTPTSAPIPLTTEPKLTRDQAIDIALKDAGFTREQVKNPEAELDRDDGNLHYDVDFEVDDQDYDYEIDANTGHILKKEIPETKPAETKPAATQTGNTISKTKARDIALKHAGLSVDQVRDLEIELDKDDGKVHYDVDFEAGGYDYDYEIDAASGKILRAEKERD